MRLTRSTRASRKRTDLATSVRERLRPARRRAAERLASLAGELHDHLTYVGVEHLPPRRAEPRWGHGRALHAGLETVIAAHRPAYDGVIAQILELSEDLAGIGIHPDGDLEPCWRNAWLPGLDTAALYTLLRTRQPRRYV
ncbi:MAG: hypothetical protein M3N21_01295 [Actinomycetota bacterium]|nr:hypothetical protein [Actinomycetota bacterium]